MTGVLFVLFESIARAVLTSAVQVTRQECWYTSLVTQSMHCLEQLGHQHVVCAAKPGHVTQGFHYTIKTCLQTAHRYKMSSCKS